MKLDNGNISNHYNKIGYQYMKLLILHFCSNKSFSTEFLDQCKNNPNESQNLPSEVKVALKKCL